MTRRRLTPYDLVWAAMMAASLAVVGLVILIFFLEAIP